MSGRSAGEKETSISIHDLEDHDCKRERMQQPSLSSQEIRNSASKKSFDEVDVYEDGEEFEICSVPEEEDDSFRQRIVARVEDLRNAKKITIQEFETLMGAHAARRWNAFITVSANRAWKDVSLLMFHKIAAIFGVKPSELLRSK